MSKCILCKKKENYIEIATWCVGYGPVCKSCKEAPNYEEKLKKYKTMEDAYDKLVNQ